MNDSGWPSGASGFGSGVYAIVDTDRLGWRDASSIALHLQDLASYARAAVAGGAVAVQLRAKGLPPGHLVRVAALTAMVSAMDPAVPLIANDDLEAARQVAGVGLHLGQSDLDVTLARSTLGSAALLGLSTHTLAQVLAAAPAAVGYLGFGPVRATTSKAQAAAVTGWSLLAAAVAAAHVPVVAIGGLQVDDLARVRGTGAHAVAVIGAWLSDGSPALAERAMARLSAAWRQAEGR